MATVEDLLWLAKAELACPRCNNAKGVMVRGEMDECPECHGDHRHPRTIELLELLARHTQFKAPKVIIDDGVAR